MSTGRDGQDTLKSILLQDTVTCENKYLITRYCQSQEKVSYYEILDTLKIII